MEDVKDYFSEYFATLFDKARQKDDGTFKTLDEMSDEINISKAALSNYVNGKREPKISSLMTIAQFFNVSPNDLLGYKAEQERDTQAVEASLYTGLSLETIEMLHRRKNNFLFIECLSFLLGSEDFLKSVVNYLLSSLHDDVAADERYCLLPGAKKVSEEEGKSFYYDIIGALPMLREHFHQTAANTNAMHKKYVSEMAMRCINHQEVYHHCFPNISYRPELSPHEAHQLNKSTMEEIESDVTSLLESTSEDEFFQVLGDPEHDNHSVLRPYFDKIHEKQALYDDQADNYLDEYYAYYSNLK